MDMLKGINRGKCQARSAAVKPSRTCAIAFRRANAGPPGVGVAAQDVLVRNPDEQQMDGIERRYRR
jgi:hypothetical protein